MSETLERALPQDLDERAERLMRVAVAVTGFAGPADEGCEEGLVHLALARRSAETRHCEEHFGALGRGPVRLKSLSAMLKMLGEAIGGKASS